MASLSDLPYLTKILKDIMCDEINEIENSHRFSQQIFITCKNVKNCTENTIFHLQLHVIYIYINSRRSAIIKKQSNT